MEGYKQRLIQEYNELRKKKEKLESIIVKFYSDELDFKLNCDIKLLIDQHYHMNKYLYILHKRIKIEINEDSI